MTENIVNHAFHFIKENFYSIEVVLLLVVVVVLK